MVGGSETTRTFTTYYWSKSQLDGFWIQNAVMLLLVVRFCLHAWCTVRVHPPPPLSLSVYVCLFVCLSMSIFIVLLSSFSVDGIIFFAHSILCFFFFFIFPFFFFLFSFGVFRVFVCLRAICKHQCIHREVALSSTSCCPQIIRTGLLTFTSSQPAEGVWGWTPTCTTQVIFSFCINWYLLFEVYRLQLRRWGWSSGNKKLERFPIVYPSVSSRCFFFLGAIPRRFTEVFFATVAAVSRNSFYTNLSMCFLTTMVLRLDYFFHTLIQVIFPSIHGLQPRALFRQFVS